MASIMLVAFASRALIAPGFMPASDRPFSVEICWDGFPAAMLGQGEPARTDSMSMDTDSMSMDSMPMDSVVAPSIAPDSIRDSMQREPVGDSMSRRGPPQGEHHHSHNEHCVFGTACSAAPIPYLPLPSALLFALQLRPVAFLAIAGAVRLVHLPQPRAPPGRLS